MIKRTISQRSEILHDIQEYGINHDTREIYLHGNLYSDDDEINYKVTSNFIKNLDFLSTMDNNRPILIHMMSCGGDMDYAMGIYDAIKACPNYVTMVGHAEVSSMASVVIQAADYRVLMPHALFLLHLADCEEGGPINKIKSFIQYYEDYDDIGLGIYAEKISESKHPDYCGKSIKVIKTKLKKILEEKRDWYIYPDEAVALNLVDGILGNECKSINQLRKENA